MNKVPPIIQRITMELSDVEVPEEILLEIFSFLNETELINTSYVCTRWYHLSTCNFIWTNRLKENQMMIYPVSNQMKSKTYFEDYCNFKKENSWFKRRLQLGAISGISFYLFFKFAYRLGRDFESFELDLDDRDDMLDAMLYVLPDGVVFLMSKLVFVFWILSFLILYPNSRIFIKIRNFLKNNFVKRFLLNYSL
jgi:hypothetical protein